MVAGLFLIVVVLWEAFETIVLPRRVTRMLRLTRLYYRLTWRPWSAVARRLADGTRREAFLSFYGPLSLLLLIGIWAGGLILGFALLQHGLGAGLEGAEQPPGFGTLLYVSGTTMFTLGLGDVKPVTGAARIITVIEAGTGFGFLAIVVSYLPVLYQAFSRREVSIALLDARAGSPPTAVELLRRHGRAQRLEALDRLLRDWEVWSAELLETHLSYPILAYYRSQHEHQSWLAALTTILDTCALAMVGLDQEAGQRAQLTFAMARHAAVDLSQIFQRPPLVPEPDRLPTSDLVQLRSALAPVGVHLCADGDAQRLAKLRLAYEPYVNALAVTLLMPLPPWLPAPEAQDDWQTSIWEQH